MPADQGPGISSLNPEATRHAMAAIPTTDILQSQLRPRLAALLEVAAVIVLLYAVHGVLRRIDSDMLVGPFAVLAALAFASWLLWRRGVTWESLGFGRPTNPGSLAGWTVALFLVEMTVPQLLRGLDLPPQDLSLFADLPGNTAKYLIMLIPVSWGTAAFGEELLYRGFINRRLTDAFGDTALAAGLALLFQAFLFSLAHAYLGARGMLNAGCLALLAGGCYLACGRRMWPLILAHGMVDSLAMTMLYLGVAHAG